jgi:hypothetical protein
MRCLRGKTIPAQPYVSTSREIAADGLGAVPAGAAELGAGCGVAVAPSWLCPRP